MTRSLLLTLLLISFLASVGQAEYQIGDLIADFSLPNCYGQNVRYSDYYDRILVMNFWQGG